MPSAIEKQIDSDHTSIEPEQASHCSEAIGQPSVLGRGEILEYSAAEIGWKLRNLGFRRHRSGYLERMQDLRAAGLDCGVPDELQEESRVLDISVALPGGNVLCELHSGVTACTMRVKLVARCSLNLILEDFRIASWWDPELIAVCRDHKGLFRVGAACEFNEHEALNSRIENGLRFCRRGDVAEGWVVAQSLRPIPDKCPNRVLAELSLTFTDQFGHDHPAQGEAILERSTWLIDFHPRVRNSPELSEVGRPTYQRGRRHDDQRSILQPKRFQAAHCSREQASLFSSIPLFFR